MVGLTEWISAGDLLLFGGALTFWIFGFASYVTGAGSSRRGLSRWHLVLSVTGLTIAIGAMWTVGAATGLTWAAGVNAADPTSFGEGWSVIAGMMEPFLAFRAAGLVIFGVAQLLFVAVVATASWRISTGTPQVEDEAFDLQLTGKGATISCPALRGGIVGVFAIVAVVMVLVPALDSSVTTASIRSETARSYPDGSAVANGRAVYIREGCVACHTQSVRPNVPDVGLGPVSVAGDYVNEAPALIGTQRLGPDLMHLGSRIENPRGLGAHLDDPRAERAWSIMPSYRYLTQGDLDALSEYLLSLR